MVIIVLVIMLAHAIVRVFVFMNLNQMRFVSRRTRLGRLRVDKALASIFYSHRQALRYLRYVRTTSISSSVPSLRRA